MIQRGKKKGHVKMSHDKSRAVLRMGATSILNEYESDSFQFNYADLQMQNLMTGVVCKL